jgi:hypothetical protein
VRTVARGKRVPAPGRRFIRRHFQWAGVFQAGGVVPKVPGGRGSGRVLVGEDVVEIVQPEREGRLCRLCEMCDCEAGCEAG